MTFATCYNVRMKWIDPLIASDLMAEIQLWNAEMIACTVTAALSKDSAILAAQVEVEVFGLFIVF